MTIYSFLIGSPDDLVIDISKVSNINDFILAIFKVAIDCVENDR